VAAPLGDPPDLVPRSPRPPAPADLATVLLREPFAEAVDADLLTEQLALVGIEQDDLPPRLAIPPTGVRPTEFSYTFGGRRPAIFATRSAVNGAFEFARAARAKTLVSLPKVATNAGSTFSLMARSPTLWIGTYQGNRLHALVGSGAVGLGLSGGFESRSVPARPPCQQPEVAERIQVGDLRRVRVRGLLHCPRPTDHLLEGSLDPLESDFEIEVIAVDRVLEPIP
jgi:hypothetical protein